MMKTLNKYRLWRKTKQGALVTGLAELGAAYITASIALDTANWLLYFATFLLLFDAIASFIRIFSIHTDVNHAKKGRSKKTA